MTAFALIPAQFRPSAPSISTPSWRTADKSTDNPAPVQYRGVHMRYEIVAERESETVRMKRNSSLIAIAKARVWASEGWSVTIVVSDEDASALVEGCSPSLA